ncbi:MAG: sigma factor-like helix-turn-helix DNA-binding protein, partial [bacterium]
MEFPRDLSAELAPLGIRVVGLRPHGMPETSMMKEVYDLKAPQIGITWEQFQAYLAGIAHNRCIDFLRRREVRQQADAAALLADFVDAVEPVGAALDRAVEHMVLALPPKERACVLLKDVLDYSLEEIADLVDSMVGGVKAALSRGRLKLASLPAPLPAARAEKPELSRLLHLYVERFNRRDWDGLKELISADAQLRVV